MSEEAKTRMLMINLKYKNMRVDIIDAALIDKKYKADINMFGEAETRMLETNLKYKSVKVDIIDAVLLDKKCEAGIQIHQG